MDFYVTLFTRVWIEIKINSDISSVKKVTLFTRVWIEMSESSNLKPRWTVTLFTRVWIEILFDDFEISKLESHSLYESVNWNKYELLKLTSLYPSLSLRECELKLRICAIIILRKLSLSLRECELKYSYNQTNYDLIKSLSLRECELKFI